MFTRSQIINIVILVLLVGAGSFFGGMTYGKSGRSQGAFRPEGFGNIDMANKTPVTANGQPRSMTTNRNTAIGEIIAKDNQSITVKIRDGGSTIILTSESMTVTQMASATTDALAIGTSILVTGTANDDGSITATTIQIQPIPDTSVPVSIPPTPTEPQQ